MNQNLFMICQQLNRTAFAPLPAGFRFRTLRRTELPVWKAMPFDNTEEAKAYQNYMDEYFQVTYARDEETFYQSTLVVSDASNRLLATGLLWKAYDLYLTVHWIKVLKAYEGQGLGRALLSKLFEAVPQTALPMYLHTQPESFRAIKLYTDFGFELLTDPIIGTRENHLFQSLPFLKQVMPEKDYQQLKFTEAPPEFIHGMAQQTTEQF